MKKPKLRFKDLLIIIGITLGLLELTLRLMPEYGTSIAKIIKTEKGWIYFRASSSKFIHHIEQTHDVYYNNFGFHDVDYFPTSDDAKTKVGFIGDSFVEGREINKEDNFVFKTRQYALDNNLSYEIYNFGVNNTGTAGQYMLWKYYIKDSFKLDKLILCVFLGNDLDNNNSFKKGDSNYSWVVTENGMIYQPPFDSTWTKKAGFFIKKNSALVNSARVLYWKKNQDRTWQATSNAAGLEIEIQKKAALSTEDSLTGLWTVQLIENWYNELKLEHTELSIMVFQDNLGLYTANEAHFMRLLEELVHKNEIPLETVRFHNPLDKHFLWRQDTDVRLGHFNENGHDSVAKITYKMLHKQ